MRSSFSELVSPPSALSAWVLAAVLFFAAVPEIEIAAGIPVSIPLLLVSVFIGLIERGVQRQVLTTRAVRIAVGLYVVAGALLCFSFVVNSLDYQIFGATQARASNYAGTLALPTLATQFFSGTLGSQDAPFMKLMFGAVIIPIAIFSVPVRSWKELRFLLIAWTAGSLFGAAYAVAYCNGYISGHWEWSWVYLRRAQGLTQHPNLLGVISLLAFPTLLLLVAECRSLLVNICCFAGMLIAWMAIDYSGSRTASGGVFILLALIYIAMAPSHKLRRRAVVIIFLVGVAGLLLVKIVLPLFNLQSVLGLDKLLSGRSTSDAVRELTNSTALEQAMNSPLLGVGYQVIQVAHNIYIQLLHAGGAVGLAGYVLSLAIPVVALSGGISAGPGRIVCAAMFGTVATLIIIYWVQSNPAHFALSLMFAMATYSGIASRSRVGFDPLGARRQSAGTAESQSHPPHVQLGKPAEPGLRSP